MLVFTGCFKEVEGVE